MQFLVCLPNLKQKFYKKLSTTSNGKCSKLHTSKFSITNMATQVRYILRFILQPGLKALMDWNTHLPSGAITFFMSNMSHF